MRVKKVAKRGGNIANNAKLDYEKEVGVKVVSSISAKDKKALETKKR